MRLFDLRQIHVVVTLERRGAVVIGLVVGCVGDRNDSGVRALEGKAVLRGKVELDLVYRFYFAVFALGRTGGLDLDDALLSVGKLSERGSVVQLDISAEREYQPLHRNFHGGHPRPPLERGVGQIFVGLDHGFLRIAEQVVEYDERSGETALPLLRVVGFVVNVDLHHAGTCFEHVAVIGRGGAESDHFHVASDLRQVEAAVLRLIDDLELSLVDDALFGTVRIDETKRNAPDVTLVGDFQRLSRNQRQLGLIAFGVDILNAGILGRERVILVELAGHIFTLGKRIGIFARNRIEIGHEKVTRLFERHPPFGYGMLGIREGHIIVVRLHALDRAEVPRQRNFIQQHLVCVISLLRSVGILAQSVIGDRQRFSAGFDCGRNAGDAGREELDREIRFRGFSDVRGVHVDLPISDSVAGSRKIDGSGRLFDGDLHGIVGDQHAIHIHKPCRRRKIDRIDGGRFRSICLFAVSGSLDRVDGGFDFPHDTVADQGIPAFWHIGVAGWSGIVVRT